MARAKKKATRTGALAPSGVIDVEAVDMNAPGPIDCVNEHSVQGDEQPVQGVGQPADTAGQPASHAAGAKRVSGINRIKQRPHQLRIPLSHFRKTNILVYTSATAPQIQRNISSLR